MTWQEHKSNQKPENTPQFVDIELANGKVYSRQWAGMAGWNVTGEKRIVKWRPHVVHLTDDRAIEEAALQTQVGGGHYKDMQIQPVEFIQANNLGFLEGCIVKRICRWRSKDGLKDLQKIKHEVDLLIQLEGLEE